MLGINAFFFNKKNQDADYIIFNKNYLTRYYNEEPFIQLYTEAMNKTLSGSRNSFEKQCRYYGIYQMVCYILNANIAGEFAECGCWRGHSAYMIAKLIRDKGLTRDFYVFDSFEGGLSNKLDEDKDLLATVDPEKVEKEKKAFYSTKKEVADNLSQFQFVKLCKGWIPEPFGAAENKRFAFVNLDLDLYQPTKDSLEFFFPRLNQGGVIVIDDYATTDWPGIKKAVDQFLHKNRVKFSIETLGSIVILK